MNSFSTFSCLCPLPAHQRHRAKVILLSFEPFFKEFSHVKPDGFALDVLLGFVICDSENPPMEAKRISLVFLNCILIHNPKEKDINIFRIVRFFAH